MPVGGGGFFHCLNLIIISCVKYLKSADSIKEVIANTLPPSYESLTPLPVNFVPYKGDHRHWNIVPLQLFHIT